MKKEKLKMKKEKLKLQVGDQVIYYDGSLIMTTSTVSSINKEAGIATLKNGIICKRESKGNNFKRADYMAKNFEGFIKKLDEEAQDLYNTWLFKQTFLYKVEELTKKIQQKIHLTQPENKALAFGENPELINYIKKVKRLIEKLEGLS